MCVVIYNDLKEREYTLGWFGLTNGGVLPRGGAFQLPREGINSAQNLDVQVMIKSTV